MEFRPLTIADRVPWARLLATCFERSPEQMEALLTWFHDGFPLVAMGAWDGDRLVAQYNCRLLELRVPGVARPARAGMGLNMAVDPAYRGRGLLDRVAGPVHEEISVRGCIAGVGFSSAAGLDVTRASRNYAYNVLGPMVSLAIPVVRRRYPTPATLSDDWPEGTMAFAEPEGDFVRFVASATSIHHRFASHPFRHYGYAVRRQDDVINGLVVYRSTRLRGLAGVSLLAAYGQDLPGLFGAFAASLRALGRHIVHVVISPNAPLRHHIGAIGPQFTVPFSRNPYHLIARALQPSTPDVLFDLDRWDCAGGDIL